MPLKRIPEQFLRDVFYSRKEFVLKMIRGDVGREDIIAEFLRHNPVLVTCGPAGPNAAPKGMSFPPKMEFLREFLDKMKKGFEERMEKHERLKLIFSYVYSPQKVDFEKLITLELAKKHTWKNISSGNDEVSILFYLPPHSCYEVRAEVEILENGPYWEYANLIHAFYHYEAPPKEYFPTYLFKIKEIYDNSEKAFGKRIYP